MKKRVLVFLSVLLCLGLTACMGQSSEQKQTGTSIQSDSSENRETDAQTPEASSGDTKTAERKVKMTVDGQEIHITLYDTPAANALYDMLPLNLTFEDFNNIEKIAYMDSELPTEGEPDEFDPDAGDLCLYAPWGNLSIFYEGFRNSNGLISLGHVDSGMDIVASMQNDFSAVLEAE